MKLILKTENYEIVEIYNQIYHIKFYKNYQLCMHFLRYQEYYESPTYYKKFFTIIDFMEWYTNSFNNGLYFSYTYDWAGFNIPSNVIDDFLIEPSPIKDFNKYDEEMIKIFKTLKTLNDKFYIIGTNFNNVCLMHELSHAFFYISCEYRNNMLKLIKHIDTEDYKSFYNLLQKDYHESVIEDEMIAYLSTGLTMKHESKLLYTNTEKFVNYFQTFYANMNTKNNQCNYNIKIVKFNNKYVLKNEHLFNSNNHWENGVPPTDYLKVISENYTHHWVDKFHTNYKKIELFEKDLIWMYEAFIIGQHTGEFSKLYTEELSDLLERYKNITKPFFNGTNYFIRTEKNSLKYGKYGVGPYTNFEEIIISMCTSISIHRAFDKDDKNCIIYLLPWNELVDIDKEFRVFVKESGITAISQQSIHKKSKWLTYKNDNELYELVNQINKFYKNNIECKLHNVDNMYNLTDDNCFRNFTFDLACTKFEYNSEEPSKTVSDFYFIEPNSFGTQYASGSALFHWINDINILYSNDDIEFRMCT